MIDAQNVAIFMSDSVRWDSTPKEITDKGLAVKTIGASSHTPTSTASMLSGCHLPEHGVGGFTDTLPPQIETILDQFPNSGLSNIGGSMDDRMLGGSFNETIYNYILERYSRRSLAEIEEPFCWFMRDPGGHSPYGHWDSEMNASTTVPEFYEEHAGNTSYLRKTYKQGVISSVERFKKHVLEPLKERGILSDTLVIFLSDHGELLGEYGHLSQSYPITPELVYVPTVYIHPDLPEKEVEITSHVDMPPTIAELLGKEWRQGKYGKSIFDHNYSRSKAYCLYDRDYPSFRGTFNYKVDSIWDEEGGHVFVRTNHWKNTKLLFGYLTKISAGNHLRRTRNPEGFKLLFKSEKTWSNPSFSKQWADDETKNINDISVDTREEEMTEETEEHLRDMGYL